MIFKLRIPLIETIMKQIDAFFSASLLNKITISLSWKTIYHYKNMKKSSENFSFFHNCKIYFCQLNTLQKFK